MSKYRTHTSDEISEKNIDEVVKIAGFLQNTRDHGGVLFLDIRDHYGIIQVVIDEDNKSLLEYAEHISKESILSIEGIIRKRDTDTINEKIKTGTIELLAQKIDLLNSPKENLPFELYPFKDIKEDVRLKYRYLDLRREQMHDNIIFRSKFIKYARKVMNKMDFLEIQTPILTASSPEGARDFIVPSRKHPGKFYALPQAPQIFKQLLMTAGFDKYFQIAPCFRDEDARSDRTSGEFYQLDMECAFVDVEDMYKLGEKVLYKLFSKFTSKKVNKEFKRISYRDSMLKYGTDKPDLRNPLEIIDLTDCFINTIFKPFKNCIVRGIKVDNIGTKSNSWFNEIVEYANSIGMPGIGYITLNKDGSFKGPIDKFLSDDERKKLIEKADMKENSVLFFIADKKFYNKYAGLIREELGRKLNLIDNDRFELCFIVDFPMFEYNEDEDKYDFTHNPFSMPQLSIENITKENIENILAFQYDIVCNGVELVSGAVRNHDLDVMKKVFQLAGYNEDTLKEKFTSLYTAFNFGAPPHAGMALGIDRMLMMLKETDNIKDIIAFPLNNNASCLMMNCPSEVYEKQLREVHIKIR